MELGGFSFTMADILNRYDVPVWYVSIHAKPQGHNSDAFHFGDTSRPWNLSHRFKDVLDDFNGIRDKLAEIKTEYGITGCLATGFKSFLLAEAGIPYKYWSFGSDLEQYCFPPRLPEDIPEAQKQEITRDFVNGPMKYQRDSFHMADAVMILPHQKKHLDRVCPDKPLFFFPYFLDIPDYDFLVAEKKQHRERICRELGAPRFFFSATRHEWVGEKPNPSDAKGNDIILKAFEAYRRLSGDSESALVLVEKGSDVEASKNLAAELGVNHSVIWLQEMSRGRVFSYYQGAALCLGQFGVPFTPAGVVEPLSLANINISYIRNPAPTVPTYEEPPPIFDSNDPAEIAAFMNEILSGPEKHETLCRKSWEWAGIHCSELRFVEVFKSLFSIE